MALHWTWALTHSHTNSQNPLAQIYLVPLSKVKLLWGYKSLINIIIILFTASFYKDYIWQSYERLGLKTEPTETGLHVLTFTNAGATQHTKGVNNFRVPLLNMTEYWQAVEELVWLQTVPATHPLCTCVLHPQRSHQTVNLNQSQYNRQPKTHIRAG